MGMRMLPIASENVVTLFTGKDTMADGMEDVENWAGSKRWRFPLTWIESCINTLPSSVGWCLVASNEPLQLNRVDLIIFISCFQIQSSTVCNKRNLQTILLHTHWYLNFQNGYENEINLELWIWFDSNFTFLQRLWTAPVFLIDSIEV